MGKNDDEKLDNLINFLLPLVRSSLGENYIEHTRDAMMDYQKFQIEFGGEWNTEKLTPLQDRVLIFRIIQIICSFYTLNVGFQKELYWKSCYDRDFKEENNKEVADDKLLDAFKKSMHSLDEFSSLVLNLRNIYKASNLEISHLLDISINEVDKEFEKAFSLFTTQMKKNGVVITD